MATVASGPALRAAWFGAAVAAMTLLAGCASEPSADEEGPAERPRSRAVLPPEGGIAGLVADTSFTPIQNATVTVVATGVNATTDFDGTFVLADVAPGSHNVLAEAAGYRPRLMPVEVTAESPGRAMFLLEALPVVEPHFEGPVEINGFVQCAASVGATFSCTSDPNHRASGRLPFARHVQAVLVEVTWLRGQGFEINPGPSLGLEGGLVFKLGWDSDGEGPRGVEARMLEPPLRFAVVNGNGPTALCSLDCDGERTRLSQAGGNVTFTINAQFPTFVYQKPYTLYYTAFYGMEPPAEYSALPE